MNAPIEVSRLVGATDDEFLKAALIAAAELGCVFHEELAETVRVTSAEAGESRRCRFTLILPDGRLVTSIQLEERRAALVRVCRAAVPYLREVAAWRALARELGVDKLTL